MNNGLILIVVVSISSTLFPIVYVSAMHPQNPVLGASGCPVNTLNPYEMMRLGRGIMVGAGVRNDSMIAVASSVGVWLYTNTFDDVAYLDTEDVLSVDWNPDGTLLAVGKGDGTVEIWTADDWTCVLSIRTNHPGGITSVQWNTTGSQFATLSWISFPDGTVQVWNADGSLYSTLLNPAVPTSFTWSPDGEQIAVGTEMGEANVFHVRSARLMMEFIDTSHASEVTSVDWSPDGSKIVTGSNGAHGCNDEISTRVDYVRIWDAVSGTLLQKLPSLVCHNEHPIAFSPDGKLLAEVTQFDEMGLNVVRLWDIDARQWVANSSGSLATDERVTVIHWLPNGSELLVMEALSFLERTDSVGSYSLNSPSHLMIWDALGDGASHILKPVGHSREVREIAWSPYVEQIVSSSSEGQTNYWDVVTGNLLYSLEEDTVASPIVWSSDGVKLAYVSGRADYRTVNIRNVVSMGLEMTIPLDAVSIMWSEDNSQLFVFTASGELHVKSITGDDADSMYQLAQGDANIKSVTIFDGEPRTV
jgi:WD40 repeat protein